MSKLAWLKGLRGADLTLTEYRVAVTLATYGNADGTSAYPSVATLAEACCLSPDATRRALHRLVGKGAVRLVKQGGNATGKGQASVYAVDLNWCRKGGAGARRRKGRKGGAGARLADHAEALQQRRSSLALAPLKPGASASPPGPLPGPLPSPEESPHSSTDSDVRARGSGEEATASAVVESSSNSDDDDNGVLHDPIESRAASRDPLLARDLKTAGLKIEDAPTFFAEVRPTVRNWRTYLRRCVGHDDLKGLRRDVTDWYAAKAEAAEADEKAKRRARAEAAGEAAMQAAMVRYGHLVDEVNALIVAAEVKQFGATRCDSDDACTADLMIAYGEALDRGLTPEAVRSQLDAMPQKWEPGRPSLAGWVASLQTEAPLPQEAKAATRSRPQGMAWAEVLRHDWTEYDRGKAKEQPCSREEFG